MDTAPLEQPLLPGLLKIISTTNAGGCLSEEPTENFPCHKYDPSQKELPLEDEPVLPIEWGQSFYKK